MGNIKERVAYLQGLTLGLDISVHSVEGKLLINIIDVLDDMAEEIDNIQMAQVDLETYIESMDEDLTDLEEEVYDDADEEDFVEVQAVTSRYNVGNHIISERDGETCSKANDSSQEE